MELCDVLYDANSPRIPTPLIKQNGRRERMQPHPESSDGQAFRAGFYHDYNR